MIKQFLARLTPAGAGRSAVLIAPFVTWGTSPDQAMLVIARVPDPQDEPDALDFAPLLEEARAFFTFG